MTPMRNVHEFDGRVRIEGIERSDPSEEATMLEEFKARPNMAGHVGAMLRDIIHDPNHKNHDPINGYNARDLLAALLGKIHRLPDEDKETWRMLLEEQIGDMARLGPCPQGRTIRLWQLYCALPTITTITTTTTTET